MIPRRHALASNRCKPYSNSLRLCVSAFNFVVFAARGMRLPAAGRCLALIAYLIAPAIAQAAESTEPRDTSRGDAMLAEYLRDETAIIADACLTDVRTLDDWTSRREEHRRQLLEMLGLDPLPPRTPLAATITGRVEHDDFIVEKLHYQSRPGLYVTGNLYLPRHIEKPAPAILYVCGHGQVKIDGVSYGNKTSYQHHGAWFARHGYVCLTIDTLQLGEIEGIHHGTHRYNMWWWLCRGYTPAGVEAWNCVRALDYLETRPEVDASRIGVTGRSGGGAYSWWIAAIDERIKCAAPVAGITDLTNHVVDGAVEGHCDCMFMVNTYRWDYAQVAALVAPRPLLLANTDSDRIFPLDGVYRVQDKVRRIYSLYGKPENFGLQISEGPHKDTQELQVAVFHWMNRHLKGEEPTIEKAAVKFFEPRDLKVFADSLPADEENTTIHETFVPTAEAPPAPESQSEWEAQRDAWMAQLREKCFRAWPAEPAALDVKQAFDVTAGEGQFAAYDFTSQGSIRLRLFIARRGRAEKPRRVELYVVDDAWFDELVAGIPIDENGELDPTVEGETEAERIRRVMPSFYEHEQSIIAFVAPRGVGPTAFDASEKKQVQNRRRYMLLGQTLDAMQVYDVLRAVEAVRAIPEHEGLDVWLKARGAMAGVALYAAVFDPTIERIALLNLPSSHSGGPYFLNVLRILDLPQAVAMAAQHTRVVIDRRDQTGWEYPLAVQEKLGWPKRNLAVKYQHARVLDELR